MVWLLILLAGNTLALWRSRAINEQQWRAALLAHNQLGRFQASLIVEKEFKKQNIRLAHFLEDLVESPIYLETVEIAYPHVELRVVIQDASRAQETISQIGSLLTKQSVRTLAVGSAVRVWMKGEL